MLKNFPLSFSSFLFLERFHCRYIYFHWKLNYKIKNSKKLGCIFILLERSYQLGFNGILITILIRGKTNYSIDVISRLARLTIKNVIRKRFHFRCKFESQMQMQKKKKQKTKKFRKKC
jgi:hypothetical protein